MYLVGMVVSIPQAVGADGDALPEHALANAGPMVNTAHLIKKFWPTRRRRNHLSATPLSQHYRTLMSPWRSMNDGPGTPPAGAVFFPRAGSWSMIRKSGNRFSEKILLKQDAGAE